MTHIYTKNYQEKSYFKSIKIVVDYSLKILFFTLLPLAIFTFITAKIPVMGMRSFVVVSGSMEPTLPIGTVIYTSLSHAYKTRDVITFKTANDTFVTHRVVSVVEKPEGVFYQTRGDANNVADSELVSEKQIVGAGVAMLPLMGKTMMAARTLPGFIAMIILPILLFIGFELWNIKKEIEKEVEKKYMMRAQTQ